MLVSELPELLEGSLLGANHPVHQTFRTVAQSIPTQRFAKG